MSEPTLAPGPRPRSEPPSCRHCNDYLRRLYWITTQHALIVGVPLWGILIALIVEAHG